MKNLFKSDSWWLLPFGLLALFLSTGTYAEKIYKWVDENGITVYSEIPPKKSIPSESLRQTPDSPVDPAEAIKKLREQIEAFDQRREDRLFAAKEGEEALQIKQRRDKICTRLRKNLQTLQTNTRIRQKVEGKEPVVLTEEQRLGQIKSTQERIQKECTDN